MVKQVNQSELEDIIKNTKIVMVDYSAVWCGPCKSLGKVLESKVVPKYENDPDVAIVKVDIDESREFAQAMNIRGVPSMMFFYEGNVYQFEDDHGPTDRIVGFHPKIDEIIDQLVSHLKTK